MIFHIGGKLQQECKDWLKLITQEGCNDINYILKRDGVFLRKDKVEVDAFVLILTFSENNGLNVFRYAYMFNDIETTIVKWLKKCSMI